MTVAGRVPANAYLAGAIVSEVVATVCLKALSSAPALLMVVVVGYAASFLLLAMTLRAGKGVGAAYGIWGASGVVLTAVASWLLFAEAITPVMAAGFALIAVGICVLEVASDRHARRAAAGSGADAGAGSDGGSGADAGLGGEAGEVA